jgi:hypothetical protein
MRAEDVPHGTGPFMLNARAHLAFVNAHAFVLFSPHCVAIAWDFTEPHETTKSIRG